MERKNRNTITGYVAGIAAGAAYGLNPLFAKPLMDQGVAVYSMLFFRYVIAALILGVWMLAKKESFRVRASQIPVLILLGVLFAMSSILLFESYNYIPAGLSTTVVYLYPVYTAVIMVFLRKYPSWQTWVAIFATLGGVILMCLPSGGVTIRVFGIVLSALSALSYSFYLVIINNGKRASSVTPHQITFYSLVTGAVMFAVIAAFKGTPIAANITGTSAILNLVGLAIFPTMVSLLGLAIATRSIGATKTAVLGVFEPVTAILVGLLAFGEEMTVTIGLGIAICIVAVLYMIITDK